MKIYLEKSKIYANLLRIKDAGKLAKYYSEVNKEFEINNKLSKESAIAFIRNSKINFINMQEFHFGIYALHTNKFIGLFSIIQPEYNKKRCEIGYWIAKKFRKNGYGKDAIKVLIYFAFNILKMKKIFAFANLNNKASINLLKSLKFKKTTTNYRSNSAFKKNKNIAYALSYKVK